MYPTESRGGWNRGGDGRAEWALEGGPNTPDHGGASRRAGGDLRYQSRRMSVRAKWALSWSVKPGGTAEVFASLLSQQEKLGTEAFSFVPLQTKKRRTKP